MPDLLATAKRDAKRKLRDAVNNLDAVRRLDDENHPVADAWREQAIRQAKDALALARELGMEPDERKI